MERSAVSVHILERNPDTAHEAVGISIEMNRITVKMLLTTDRKVEGLKGKWFTSIEMAEKIKNDWLQRQGADRSMLHPAILKTRRTTLAMQPEVELLDKTGLQVLNHGVRHAQKDWIIEVDDAVTLPMQHGRFVRPASKLPSRL
jgi:hypothetical protein